MWPPKPKYYLFFRKYDRYDQNSKKVSLSCSNNDRQMEMAAEAGNTYISGDNVEIVTANPALLAMTNSVKLYKVIAATTCSRK